MLALGGVEVYEGAMSPSPQDAAACDEELLALEEAVRSPAAREDLEALLASGVLANVLPEVANLVAFHTDFPGQHKDLWDHTMQVLERLPPRGELRWGALLHDIGKVPTRALQPHGKVTFWRHEQVGGEMARVIGERLGWPAERTEHVAFIVEYHGRFNAYERGWSDGAVRRLIRDAGDYLDDLMTFSSADLTTGNPRKERRARREEASLHERISRLLLTPPKLPSDLGETLIQAFDLQPGPGMGRVMDFLREKLVSGEISADSERGVFVEALRAAEGRGEFRLDEGVS